MRFTKFSLIFIIVLFTFLYSCTITKDVTIKFKKVENEISFNDNLKTFIKTNKSPSIVLRIPGGASTMTSSQAGKGNQIYNTIENSLMKNGFTVRDRALFNEVVDKIDATDYSKIYNLTKTDLIIELVSLNTKVKYTTNR
jgi:hypothetical protein